MALITYGQVLVFCEERFRLLTSSQCWQMTETANIPHVEGWQKQLCHDDAIKRKPFPRYWPFVRGIHQSPVNSLHKGQWRGGLMFSLLCARINGWVNNGEAGDLRRYRAHYDVTVMYLPVLASASAATALTLGSASSVNSNNMEITAGVWKDPEVK